MGKTWVVRHLAQSQGKEINFEDTSALVAAFESNDPKKILICLESAFNERIDPALCILFLDEIQAAP